MNIDKSKFALLAIDLQEDFREDTEDFPEFESNIKRLFFRMRQEGIEIIHINGMYKPDKSDWMNWNILRGGTVLCEGTGGEKRMPYAEAEGNEKIIIKKGFDGFLKTELEDYLTKKGIKCLFICGLVTTVCVLTTTLTAIQKGYLVSVLRDCSADEKQSHEFFMADYDNLIRPIEINSIEDRMAEMQKDMATLGIE